MSARASDLMGLGIAPAVATLLGDEVATVAGATTAQATAAALPVPPTGVVRVTTASGETAVRLSADLPLLRPVYVFNTTATAALLFPPTGGAIDGGTANASVAIAQNRGRMVIRLSATDFRTVYGA